MVENWTNLIVLDFCTGKMKSPLAWTGMLGSEQGEERGEGRAVLLVEYLIAPDYLTRN